jgi:hypothetical protein
MFGWQKLLEIKGTKSSEYTDSSGLRHGRLHTFQEIEKWQSDPT